MRLAYIVENKNTDDAYAGLETRAKTGDKQAIAQAQEMVNDAGIEKAKSLPKIKVGDTVDGLVVREDIPNASSISSSLENYESFGLRSVPMSLFGLMTGQSFAGRDIHALALAISRSKEINPLIVVMSGHKDGPAYILEGSHRIDALAMLKKKSFPALVLYDYDETDAFAYHDSGTLIPLSERFNS